MLIGTLIGLLARLWLATLRVRSAVHPELEAQGEVPWVLAHWHGQIMPLLAFRRRRATVAMVSRSPDGERMAQALKWLGLQTVRGSSSLGGREGLAAVVAMLKTGVDGVLAVDGPRGPRHAPKAGALAAARRVGGVVVPFAAHCGRAWIVGGSWDKFEIPLPFSRVGVVLGAPLPVPRGSQAVDLTPLACAIHQAEQDARRLVSRGSGRTPHWTATESA